MESFLNDVKQKVQCSLCEDTLIEPKILKCFHTFCKPCIKRHAELIYEANVFKCPKCSSETFLPKLSNVDDLHSSLLDSRILKGLALVESEKVCSVSESHSPASWYCFVCDHSLCLECRNYHSFFTKDHKLVRLADLKKEDFEQIIARENHCNSHPNQRLELFCEDCDAMICLTCLKQAHRDHKTITLDKFASIKKALLSKHLQVLEHLRLDEKEKQEQQQIAYKIAQEGEKAIKEVKEKTKEMIEILQENERELLRQIDEKLYTAKRNLNIIHHISAVEEYINNVMERGLASEMVNIQEKECSEKFIFNSIPPYTKITFVPNKELMKQVNSGLGEIQTKRTYHEMSSIQVKTKALKKNKLFPTTELLSREFEIFSVVTAELDPSFFKISASELNEHLIEAAKRIHFKFIETCEGFTISGTLEQIDQACLCLSKYATPHCAKNVANVGGKGQKESDLDEQADSHLDGQEESDLEPVILDVEPKLMHILHNKVRSIEKKYKMKIDLKQEKNKVHLSPKGTNEKLFYDGKEEFILLYQKEFQDLEEKDYSLDGIDKNTNVYKMVKVLMDEFNVVIDKREGNWIHIFGNKDQVSRVIQELQTMSGKRKQRRAYKGPVNEELPKPDTYAQRAMSPLSRTLENGVVLSVHQGDITKEHVDVIVNAANEHLDHGGGVAGAIVRQGGRQIQQESDALVRQYGCVPVGQVAWTGPGRLPCKRIFHAVGPQWRVHGEVGCRHLIFRACVNSFNIASQQKMCSIAIPGISSGVYGVPVKICAEMMFSAAEQFSCEASSNNQLKDIRFVNSDTPTYEAFRREFNNRYGMKGTSNIPQSRNINLATHPHEAYKATRTERELFSNQTNISNRNILNVRGKNQTTAGEDSGLSRAGVATLKKKEQEEKEKEMEEKKEKLEEKRTEENHFDQTDATDIYKLTVRREHQIIEEKDSKLSIFMQIAKKIEMSFTGVRNTTQEIMQGTNERETCLAEERQKHLEISLATERQTHQDTTQRISELETLLVAERQIHQEARRRLKELETSLAGEKQRTNELETSLSEERQKHQETRQRTSELETSLAAERQKHQEKRERTSELEISLAAERQTHQETRQRTIELEISLETERQRTNELETSLAEERQTHQEIRQRTNELETSLETERQTHQETRQRTSELETSLETERQEYQETRERTNELETTLTAIQQTLEEYRNSREARDWVLARNEISLSTQVIGEGAWGKVMEGTFRGCKVAVKQIHDLILSPHNRRRFEREMSIASRCRHPCLLQFIGATNDDQSPLFVTELLDTSLREVLQERALDPTEITAIALDIAKGLNYLHLSHPAPIIHRDISSANVLLWKQNNRWRGKVADYGTANFLQLSMTTCPGAAVYSAPESQTSTQTPKVDVYSFGVLLCEMNNRELPDVEHRNDQIVMVTDHFFRGLIRRCLHKDPKERPSMKEILDELSSYQSQ